MPVFPFSSSPPPQRGYLQGVLAFLLLVGLLGLAWHHTLDSHYTHPSSQGLNDIQTLFASSLISLKPLPARIHGARLASLHKSSVPWVRQIAKMPARTPSLRNLGKIRSGGAYQPQPSNHHYPFQLHAADDMHFSYLDGESLNNEKSQRSVMNSLEREEKHARIRDRENDGSTSTRTTTTRSLNPLNRVGAFIVLTVFTAWVWNRYGKLRSKDTDSGDDAFLSGKTMTMVKGLSVHSSSEASSVDHDHQEQYIPTLAPLHLDLKPSLTLLQGRQYQQQRQHSQQHNERLRVSLLAVQGNATTTYGISTRNFSFSCFSSSYLGPDWRPTRSNASKRLGRDKGGTFTSRVSTALAVLPSSSPTAVPEPSLIDRYRYSGVSSASDMSDGSSIADVTRNLTFHHVMLYADALQPLEHYKKLEERTAQFSQKITNESTVEEGVAIWNALTGASKGAKGEAADANYESFGQDLVEQMIVGFGWRVRFARDGKDTRAVAITSPDETGATFIIMAPLSPKSSPAKKKQKKESGEEEEFDHFKKSHIDTFYGCHANRQGVAVLAFELPAGGVDKVHESYNKLHPSLVKSASVAEHKYTVDGKATVCKIFEAYAYYKPADKAGPKKADVGTVLRFVEFEGGSKGLPPLPGLERCEVGSFERDYKKSVAYSDHWVSNVVDREGFMQCMSEVLGFTSKVDFNAGVVAAGEAVIESTVIGNDPTVGAFNKDEMLLNQNQIYLPTNNPVSEVGHVHMFIDEMGQGIQHLASRVEDLISFIGSVNRYRKMTGQGFTFLNIPMSYYGRLTENDLLKVKSTTMTPQKAKSLLTALEKEGLMSPQGLVRLEASRAEMKTVVQKIFSDSVEEVVTVVSQGRYNNLKRLLGDHFCEETYLKIVENKILVDIQGDDILFQIFTSCVLQRNKGEEAPFLEFIQRVCSEKIDPRTGNPVPLRPGCGGFGIRNFLTLFLSIEVSKAMGEYESAKAEGDERKKELAQRKIALFTEQLEESNPILTAISDAMTAEGDALSESNDPARSEEERRNARTLAEQQAKVKEGLNKDLMVCSSKYKAKMAALRGEA